MPFEIPDELASPTALSTLQSTPKKVDFDTVAAASALTGIVSGGTVTQSASPGMKIDLSDATEYRATGRPYSAATQADVAVIASHGSLNRYDTVSLNTSGTLIVTAGTPEADPVAANVPAGNTHVAEVTVRAAVTQINTADITPKGVPVPSHNGAHNVDWYGAAADGTDDSTEIGLAITAAEAETPVGTVYFPAKIYTIDFGISFINCSVYAEQGAQLLIGDSVTGDAVTFGSASTYMRNQRLVMPHIQRETQLWTQAGNSATLQSDRGIKIKAMYESEIYVQKMTNFSYGLDLAGDTKGVAYNDFYLGHFENNAIQIAGLPVTTGWSNENNFFGGRCELYANGASARITNTRCVQMGDNDTLAKPDNWRFYGTSFEGEYEEKAAECWGSDNSWFACRWEGTDKEVEFNAYTGTYPAGNLIFYGYDAKILTFTELNNAAGRNHLYSPTKSIIGGSQSSGGFFRFRNQNSNQVPDIATFWHDQDPDANPDNWSWAMGAQYIDGKVAAGSYPKLRFDSSNGRIYIGDGSGDPTAYIAAGTSGGDLAFDAVIDMQGNAIRAANQPTRYTTTQTLDEDDRLINCDGSAFTVTLPLLSGINLPHAVMIFAGGSGDITVAPGGSDQIDGSGSSKVLTGNETPPAAIGLVAYDTTDDWETVSIQGTVT